MNVTVAAEKPNKKKCGSTPAINVGTDAQIMLLKIVI